MPEDPAAHFYDEPVDDYHLLHADWNTSVRRQGDALHGPMGRDQASVLDCSCGIGTQAMSFKG